MDFKYMVQCLPSTIKPDLNVQLHSIFPRVAALPTKLYISFYYFVKIFIFNCKLTVICTQSNVIYENSVE
jgi:hypothetical protein